MNRLRRPPPTLDRPQSVAGGLARLMMLGYTASLVGNALGAYNFGSVPIPWLAQCVTILVVLYLIVLRGQVISVPGMGLFAALVVWGVAVTAIGTWLTDYEDMMPIFTTTSYPVFVGLRFLRFAAFAAQLYLTYWLLDRGHTKWVVSQLVGVGTLVAAAALYIYVAQIYNLPELPRNRLGGSGFEQNTTFSYAFHRAMGTFGEPANLAEWLVTPFFLSLATRSTALALRSGLMGLVILMTGSMTGIVGGTLGLIAAVALIQPSSLYRSKVVLRLGWILAAGGVGFSFLAVAYDQGHTNLWQLIYDRLEPILFGGGLIESNRGYIYEFVEESELPVLGHGFGNANLAITAELNSQIIISFLSIYLNALYSAGPVGLVLMLAFFARPILAAWRQRNAAVGDRVLCFAAYCTWLATYGVRSEEFSVLFAVVFALACYQTQSKRRQETIASGAQAELAPAIPSRSTPQRPVPRRKNSQLSTV